MVFRSTPLFAVALALFIGGCAHAPPEPPRAPAPSAPSAPAQPAPATSTAPTPSTNYYKDDGPGSSVPANIDAIPDAVPRREELNRFASRPYTVLGRGYVPATELKPYKERGIASWYGRRFHGQKTSIGETYDMYAMSAAHPTLPLPSYARVTSVASGRSVVVRINDRGPFLHDRIIDLSYAAAYRLGIAQSGSGEVDVEAILPAAIADSPATARAPLTPVASAAPIAPPLAPPAEIRLAEQGDAAALSAAPLSTLRGGYSVQLGAFANFANAQAFLARAQNQLATAQVEAKIRQAGGLYRVYIGPYPVRSDAERMGERVTQAFGFPTTVAAH
jgi:rare lipoprotein A